MQTRLSSKGQVVLPRLARQKLHLRAGVKFTCRIDGDSIVLTPEDSSKHVPKIAKDPKTGLMITKTEGPLLVSSEDVRAALADFP